MECGPVATNDPGLLLCVSGVEAVKDVAATSPLFGWAVDAVRARGVDDCYLVHLHPSDGDEPGA